ncbi:hypothetical protein PACILC2_11370 [Paenibacillus cisolokensis]|uniref:Uncharacterized protein n=1 Tax=Paenibacillus cisolokensis TaxID=1658519 RepID=A0ABQ4N333_9BACL|nr:hypothetical protein PACILC2_11370 [Paenibacillus cisolokensis]
MKRLTSLFDKNKADGNNRNGFVFTIVMLTYVQNTGFVKLYSGINARCPLSAQMSGNN